MDLFEPIYTDDETYPCQNILFGVFAVGNYIDKLVLYNQEGSGIFYDFTMLVCLYWYKICSQITDVNSLWPRHAIWVRRSESTLTQAKALGTFSSEVLWNSTVNHFAARVQAIILHNDFESFTFEINSTTPLARWGSDGISLTCVFIIYLSVSLLLACTSMVVLVLCPGGGYEIVPCLDTFLPWKMYMMYRQILRDPWYSHLL